MEEPARAVPPWTDRFVEGLRSGDPAVIEGLRARCERVAARRFAGWAWQNIRDDFHADLVAQLATSVGRPVFQLRGHALSYVDSCILNLCKRYFLLIARMRRNDDLQPHQELLRAPTVDALERIATVLDLQAALAALGEPCREWVLWKYVDGVSLEDMGLRVGVSAQTMRSRLHECRARLRTHWQRITGGPQARRAPRPAEGTPADAHGGRAQHPAGSGLFRRGG